MTDEAKNTGINILNNIIDCKNPIYHVCFELLIPIPENMFFHIMNMWDLFRLTDPQCLEKFPDNKHIHERNPVLPQVNEKIYNDLVQLFKKMIEIEGDRALLIKFHNTTCADAILHINAVKEITLFEVAGLKAELTDGGSNTTCVMCKMVSLDGT